MSPLNPPSELTVEEALKMVQKVDRMITIDSLGNLDEWKQSFPTIKTGMSVKKAFDEWRERLKDGLTSEEQGPCT